MLSKVILTSEFYWRWHEYVSNKQTKTHQNWGVCVTHTHTQDWPPAEVRAYVTITVTFHTARCKTTDAFEEEEVFLSPLWLLLSSFMCDSGTAMLPLDVSERHFCMKWFARSHSSHIYSLLVPPDGSITPRQADKCTAWHSNISRGCEG